MDDLVLILRMVERITAVLIGGLSIYLGYRLFYHLPFVRDSEGQLEMPGVKIVLSRIGPGVFFAAFGSMVLFYSFTHEVTYTLSDNENIVVAKTPNSNPVITKKFTGISGATTAGSSATPQQRNKALTSIEMLNCARRLILREGTSPGLKDNLTLAIDDAKRALIVSVWNEDDWGSREQLEVTGLIEGTPYQLQMMFNSTYEGCPK